MPDAPSRRQLLGTPPPLPLSTFLDLGVEPPTFAFDPTKPTKRASPVKHTPAQLRAQALMMGLADLVRGATIGATDEKDTSAAQIGELIQTGLPLLKGAALLRGGIKAYHGSPHKFKKFDVSKVGTGEGAQVYGHGLYFAENPTVAEIYRNNLAGMPELENLKLGSLNVGSRNGFDYSPKGNSTYENVRSSLAEDLLLDQAALTGVPPDQLQAHVLKRLDEKISDYTKEWPEAVKDAQKLRADLARPKAVSLTYGNRPGQTYEVDIKAEPEQFLDWDKPLKEQPQAVKSLANEMFRGRLTTRDIGSDLVDVYEKGGGSIGVFPRDKVPEVLANPADYYPFKGEQLYRQLAGDKWPSGAPRFSGRPRIEEASATLKEQGVPGIRYADQGSRGGRPPYQGDTAYLHAASSFKVWDKSPDAALEGMKQAYPSANEAELRAAVNEIYNITPPQTSNYVVFDDKLIDILRKYGWLPPIAGLGALSQIDKKAVEQRPQ